MAPTSMRGGTIADALRESVPVHFALAFAFVVMAIFGILDTRLYALRHRTLTRRIEDRSSIPSAHTVALLSLGHREWAADLLWTAALVYFGDTLVEHQQQALLQQYADTMETIDPHFRQAYLWGATVSIYNTRVIRRDSVENSIRHLEHGLRVFPDDGEMTYQLGFDYYFELPRLLDNEDERAEMRRRGAEYLRRAAALGYGPSWMGLAAAEALQRSGLADRALDELHDLYLRTDDPRVRANIEGQIRDLLAQRGGGQDPYFDALRRMDAERREWFPYVGSMLYLFVGPPVPGVAQPKPVPTDSASAASSAGD